MLLGLKSNASLFAPFCKVMSKSIKNLSSLDDDSDCSSSFHGIRFYLNCEDPAQPPSPQSITLKKQDIPAEIRVAEPPTMRRSTAKKNLPPPGTTFAPPNPYMESDWSEEDYRMVSDMVDQAEKEEEERVRGMEERAAMVTPNVSKQSRQEDWRQLDVSPKSLAIMLANETAGLDLSVDQKEKFKNSSENTVGYEKRKQSNFDRMLAIMEEKGGPYLSRLASETVSDGLDGEIPYLIQILRSCDDKRVILKIIDSCLKHFT